MFVKTHKLLENLLQAAPDAMLAVDAQGRVLAANGQAEVMFGYAAGALRGKLVETLLPEAMRATHADHRMKYFASPQTRSMGQGLDLLGRFQDGATFPVEISLRPVDTGGEVYTVAAIRDISERRRAEAQLRTLSRAVEQSASIVIITDAQGKIEWVNPKFSEVTGYTLDEVKGQNPRLLKSGRTSTEEYRQLWETITAGHEWHGEFHNHKKNGDIYWASATISPVVDANDAISHFVAIQEDITERKRIEEAEREQRTLVSALRQTAAALTSTLDLGEVLERILKSLARVVPHDAADLILLENGEVRIVKTRGNAPEAQDNVLRLHLPIDRPSNIRTMLLTGQPLIIEDVHQDPDWIFAAGTEWMHAYVGAPIRLEGEAIGFLSLASATPGFFTQTHAQSLQALAEHAAIALRNANLYEALRRQTEELEARNAELDAFGHTVAHDLRSPLAIIVGYLAVLAEMEGECLTKHGRALLGEAQQSANKMDQIIQTLLLLARLHSVEETIAPVDMRPVTEAALARCRQDIAARGIKVITGDNLPQVLGYGPWLEEVLTNLIQNAVKYMGWSNPDPRIAIQARAEDGAIRYEVQDNGMGIAQKDQEHLFERFTRFHEAHASGSGLGLSIVHRIITRLGGQLGVESEQDQGSTFWFS